MTPKAQSNNNCCKVWALFSVPLNLFDLTDLTSMFDSTTGMTDESSGSTLFLPICCDGCGNEKRTGSLDFIYSVLFTCCYWFRGVLLIYIGSWSGSEYVEGNCGFCLILIFKLISKGDADTHGDVLEWSSLVGRSLHSRLGLWLQLGDIFGNSPFLLKETHPLLISFAKLYLGAPVSKILN